MRSVMPGAGACAVTGPRVYPFTAIVDQEEMKLALLLSCIDPHLGSVLILGHRGTGAATAIRALAALLPEIPKVRGCARGCDPHNPSEWCPACLARRQGARRLPYSRGPVPLVELAPEAAEDDVRAAIANAHRGFLFVDELNLPPDRLAGLLFGSGPVAGRFILVVSAALQEGVRPAMLDRFGLCARAPAIADPHARVQMVRRRQRFERDPDAFAAGFQASQAAERLRIARARQHISRVAADPFLLTRIEELCRSLGLEGHRGELAVIYAAKTLAALEGRLRVAVDDVRRVAPLALIHRVHPPRLDAADCIASTFDQVLAGGLHRTA